MTKAQKSKCTNLWSLRYHRSFKLTNEPPINETFCTQLRKTMRWRTIQLYWNKLFSSSCKKFNFSSITISLWTQWLRGTCYYRKFKKATDLPVINANAIFRKCNINVISSSSRYSSCFVDCLCLTSSFPLPSSWKY